MPPPKQPQTVSGTFKIIFAYSFSHIYHPNCEEDFCHLVISVYKNINCVSTYNPSSQLQQESEDELTRLSVNFQHGPSPVTSRVVRQHTISNFPIFFLNCKLILSQI